MTRFWIRPLLAALLLLAAVPAGCRRDARPPSGEPLHVGFMICNSLPETTARFAPLCAWLSERLGRPVIAHYVNTGDMEKELARGAIQVAHTNSLLYVIFQEQHGWRLMAGERQGSHGSNTAGVIIVRADSPAKTLADLKNRRVVFGPQLAPLGFLAPYVLLQDGGVDPDIDLASYSFTHGAFTHEKVVYSVLFGGADAGGVPLLDLEEMERDGKIRPDEYRVLATSEFAPYCTFSASPALPAEVRELFEESLLALTRDATVRVDGEVLRVMERAGVDGFERRQDADYDIIRRMARQANMPPYQRF